MEVTRGFNSIQWLQVQVHLFHSKHIMLHEVQKNYIQKYKKSRICTIYPRFRFPCSFKLYSYQKSRKSYGVSGRRILCYQLGSQIGRNVGRETYNKKLTITITPDILRKFCVVYGNQSCNLTDIIFFVFTKFCWSLFVEKSKTDC